MKPQKPSSEPANNIIEAEIQHNIPVKLHITDELKNPIAAIKQFVDHDNKKDEDLDHVLKDVNKSVKDSDEKPDKKFKFSFFRKRPVDKTEKLAQTQEAKNSKPLQSVVVAVLVAVGLSVAAFYAFSHTKNPAKEATVSNKPTSSNSTQPADSTKLSSVDISKLSSELQSKIDALNDVQDFGAADLSDKNLGL